ncbi:unnamed protein product [Aspergillus oryzae]|uniref:Unnamed protein product n=2 Tax=Aspergillus oryzae TaxID=5062 RepID=A0AAN4YJY2_ASPOZ|nr:unnamed protein product [Aspergillus oryzae]GMF90019.1 unnamed protein product [Aspergillus oryzae]GMG10896.1 unnamed protein product [Aspergillus oryzae]GMG27570.1 unnamed protein product [Aspergillus oryzae]GMG49872.1 unnamed protein product [Aspergillus oryzae var. brunneus]
MMLSSSGIPGESHINVALALAGSLRDSLDHGQPATFLDHVRMPNAVVLSLWYTPVSYFWTGWTGEKTSTCIDSSGNSWYRATMQMRCPGSMHYHLSWLANLKALLWQNKEDSGASSQLLCNIRQE